MNGKVGARAVCERGVRARACVLCGTICGIEIEVVCFFRQVPYFFGTQEFLLLIVLLLLP